VVTRTRKKEKLPKISTHADGGPRTRVCACETLSAAPSLVLNSGGKKKSKKRKKDLKYGHLRLCQQPRAAHALRSDPERNVPNICL
jgi:hypothetical protein